MSTNVNERAAARYLGCSPALLKKMRAENRGPKYTMVGKRLVRYPLRWLEEYVERNAIRGETGADRPLRPPPERPGQ